MAAKATKRGFPDLPCPKCSACGDIAVKLEDVDSFYCGSCSEEFTRADVERFIAAWQKVFAWLATAPEE